MSTPQDYLHAVRSLLDHHEQALLPTVEAAADIIIASITQGGAVFCSEIGHGNQGDFINRAGGLAVVQPFTFNCNIHDPVAECRKDRPRPAPINREIEVVRLAVRASNLRAGDVMLVSSVSGRNTRPVELALACHEMGVKTIGFTSMAYTGEVQSLHPSGKRLCDAVDVVVDIGVPYGDAGVDIAGYDFKLIPLSGIAMITAGWMIWGRVMEKMAAAGDPPSVFMSFNRAGGEEYYKQAQAQYQKRGY